MKRLNAVIWITALIILVAPAGAAFAAQGMGPDGQPVKEDESGRLLKKLPKKAKVEAEPPENRVKLPESNSLKDVKHDPASAALSKEEQEERRARLLQMYSKNPKKFRSNPRRAFIPSPLQPEAAAASDKAEKTSPIAMIIGSAVSFILIVLLIMRMRHRQLNDPIRVSIPRTAPGDDQLPDEPPPDRKKQMGWVEDYMKQQSNESESGRHQNYSDFD